MHSPKKIVWYYDFISPYAYLASQALDRFPSTVEIECRPILFAGILKQWDTRGPGEIAPMRKFTYRQIAWLAEKHAIPLNFPPIHPFNPLKLLRLNIALGERLDIADRLFRFVWAEGNSSDDPVAWAALVSDFGLTVEQAEKLIGDQAVKARLISETDAAIAKGIFGVPGFIVEDEVFWGFDSMPFIMDYLEEPKLFTQPTMHQADGVGEGIKRK
ncbi:2-hydroxychromene-2-carboxylate isomerase [Sedimenticola selenatireducens]|jgi:2-hydroxychromene-2-carboxylate isomerase|uniref:2-hydroxychromene-2-carboxylate isomerase n=1 Tax=Sedimenticola selenatireducens TaxID=191960 RepID=A0A558DQT1_9GAMM|nr:2-hydroxychromene-2-carboxylate isomerase [Sedimenticola selenatireducens]TVO73448.1 2-hydroxychromene-2-carboxylate isomerase [Sedimenticola selenatireducens]TVT63389.1 MAG: 2-hydroxychromene-2-carboxylate isomerase [Sedimenticola selenatireducens]